MTEAEFRQKDLEFMAKQLEFIKTQIRHNLEMLKLTQARIDLVQDYRTHLENVPDPKPEPGAAAQTFDPAKPLHVMDKDTGAVCSVDHVYELATQEFLVVFDQRRQAALFEANGEEFGGPLRLQNVPSQEPVA